MTPTATYIAEENCLQEISQIEAPKYRVSHWPHGSLQYYNSLKAWGEYNAHLATLRKIPCDPSCKGLWADGQKLVVGKDYGVRDYPIRAMLPTDPKFIAFPLVPVKSENAIWQRLLTYFKDGFADFKTDEEVIDDLKKYFILTPKQ